MQMEMKEGKGEPLDRRKLKVLNVKTGKAAEVSDTPLNGEIQSYCWSPDGKRIAYAWREVHVGKPEDVAKRETESFLVLCNPTGRMPGPSPRKNPKASGPSQSVTSTGARAPGHLATRFL